MLGKSEILGKKNQYFFYFITNENYQTIKNQTIKKKL